MKRIINFVFLVMSCSLLASQTEDDAAVIQKGLRARQESFVGIPAAGASDSVVPVPGSPTLKPSISKVDSMRKSASKQVLSKINAIDRRMTEILSTDDLILMSQQIINQTKQDKTRLRSEKAQKVQKEIGDMHETYALLIAQAAEASSIREKNELTQKMHVLQGSLRLKEKEYKRLSNPIVPTAAAGGQSPVSELSPTEPQDAAAIEKKALALLAHDELQLSSISKPEHLARESSSRSSADVLNNMSLETIHFLGTMLKDITDKHNEFAEAAKEAEGKVVYSVECDGNPHSCGVSKPLNNVMSAAAGAALTLASVYLKST